MPYFGKKKTLGIFVPPGLRNRFGVPQTWIDGDGYLLLPFLPEDIADNDTFLGDSGYTPGFTRMIYNGPRRVQRGYELTTSEARIGVYYLLTEIAKLTSGNPYQPVLVKDYLRPEAEDFEAGLASNTEPFTLRAGALSEIKLASGVIGALPSKMYAAEGFTFKFQEEAARPC
jgi:hypothetical protein